jgi:hypothetical protein
MMCSTGNENGRFGGDFAIDVSLDDTSVNGVYWRRGFFPGTGSKNGEPEQTEEPEKAISQGFEESFSVFFVPSDSPLFDPEPR